MAIIVDQGGASAGKPAILASAKQKTAQRDLDYFNWAAAIEKEKKAAQTKQAAKTKLKTIAAKPKPVVQAAGAGPAAPVPSAKELLDAFRAFHNGALPPGITPDMAALIDSGINIQGMAATNPAMANVMLQVQQALSQIPADYAAGKASVNQSYDKLTGDVLDSGKQWMQDLYGRIVDPNDPNAALAQKDPALTAYGQSMSQIDETSDANRATDLAWFDKMQQNSSQMYQNMLAQLAAQAATPVAAKGGGGGGRGRRGGRGGGGGSGSGVWKAASNKLANLQSATDTATDTTTGYSPDFHQALMDYTAADPEEQAFAQRQWELSPQDARGLTQLNAKDLGSAESVLKSLELQKGLNAGWLQQSPAHLQDAVNTMIRNKPGAILGDDPNTKPIETYYIPTVKGQPQTVPPTPTPEQALQNQMAEELLLNPSNYQARTTASRIFNPKGNVRKPVGVLSPAGSMEWDTKGAISPQQIKIMARYGQNAATAAQQHDTSQQPFDWKAWAEGGNYVPPADEKLAKDTARNIGFLNDLNSFILQWNPNANFVPTKRTLTSQGKDSSTYTSSTTNKGNANALQGNPLNLTPSLSAGVVDKIPISGGSNPDYNNVWDPAGDGTDELTGGAGMGRLLRLPAGSRAILDEAAASSGALKSSAKGRIASSLRTPIAQRPQQRPQPVAVQETPTYTLTSARTSTRPAPVYHSFTDFVFGNQTPAPTTGKFVQGRGPVVQKKAAASPFTGFAARLFHK